MAAERLAGYGQKVSIIERTKIFQRNNGIIFGNKDVDRYIQILKGFLTERVQIEIIAIGRKLGKIPHHVGRKCHTGFGMESLIEIVPVGEKPLLLLEGASPFLQEVFSIEGLAAVNSQCRLIRIEGRAYSKHVLQIMDRRLCVLDSDAQSKVSAERKAEQISRQIFRPAGKRINGIERFLEECAVKQTFVQMMRFSVISQIQSADGESPVKIE